MATLYKIFEEYGIQRTSADTFSNINPNYARIVFINKSIIVAPRQSLYSTAFKSNLFFNSSNFQFWNSKEEGGHLFETLLGNEVSIFMTHFGHYGSDRLAVSLFENLFSFTTCWTNLVFYSLPPADFVYKYFELNQNEKEPLWTVREF